MRRIAVIRTDRIGDLLMTLPAVGALRARYPDAAIDLIALKNAAPLLTGYPQIQAIYSYDPEEGPELFQTIRWAARLRAKHYDAVIVFNPNRLFHAAAFLAGIPVRAGYSRKCGFFLNRTIADTKASRLRHESEYNLELVRLLDARAEMADLQLWISIENAERARQLLKNSGVPEKSKPVAIHPWTSNPVKSWPMESFIQTAIALAKNGLPVILIGQPEGPYRTENRCLDLTGKIPLPLLPAVLSECAGLISNDSGPAHVAAAVGTPLIVVAPESHEPMLRRWAPLGKNQQILYSPTPEIVAHQALLQFRANS